MKEKSRLEKFQDYIDKVVEIKNLTPHTITLLDDSPASTSYEPVGRPLRIPEEYVEVAKYLGHSIQSKRLLVDRVRLPDYEEGVLNIVSLVVAQYVAVHEPHRVDFVTVGKLLRNDLGHIVGIENLSFVE